LARVFPYHMTTQKEKEILESDDTKGAFGAPPCVWFTGGESFRGEMARWGSSKMKKIDLFVPTFFRQLCPLITHGGGATK